MPSSDGNNAAFNLLFVSVLLPWAKCVEVFIILIKRHPVTIVGVILIGKLAITLDNITTMVLYA